MFGLGKKDENEEKKKEAEDKKAEEEKKKEASTPKYEFKPGDYSIQIHILQAKELLPREGLGANFLSNNAGSANPMVEVEVLEEKKKSKVVKGTLSPIFNDQIFFQFKELDLEMLNSASLMFSVYDCGTLTRNQLMGSATLDLAYVYTELDNHDIYRQWLGLINTEDGCDGDVQGYLMISVQVLGPGEEPTVHDPSKDKGGGVMVPPRIKMTPHKITVNVHEGRDLIGLDWGGKSDPYAIVEFGKADGRTRTIDKTVNPKWNQSIDIASMMPSMIKSIKVQIWDDDMLRADDLIGTFKLKFKDVKNKTYGPKWHNIYGPPAEGDGPAAEKMLKFPKRANTFRGRVLLSASSEDAKEVENAIKEFTQEVILPEESEYVLRVEIMEALELSEIGECCIHVTMGGDILMSPTISLEGSRAIFYEALDDLIVKYPSDMTQCPDIILYLATGPKPEHRICFLRFPADEIFNGSGETIKPELYKFEEEDCKNALTDDDIPGYLFARVQLIPKDKTPALSKELRVSKSFKYTEYQLRVHLFQGRELPPADESGASDPFVVARCAGQKKRSKILKATLNPGWFETMILDVKLPPFTINYPIPLLSILVFDDDAWGRKDILGSFLIDMDGEAVTVDVDGTSVDLIAQEPPRWYNLEYDEKTEGTGKILVGYELMLAGEASKYPLPELLRPPSFEATIDFLLLGLRNVIDGVELIPTSRAHLELDISGDTREPLKTKRYVIDKNNSCNIMEFISYTIDIPYIPIFSPVLSVSLLDHPPLMRQRLIGTCNLILDQLVSKFWAKLPQQVNWTRSLSPYVMRNLSAMDEEYQVQTRESDKLHRGPTVVLTEADPVDMAPAGKKKGVISRTGKSAKDNVEGESKNIQAEKVEVVDDGDIDIDINMKEMKVKFEEAVKPGEEEKKADGTIKTDTKSTLADGKTGTDEGKTYTFDESGKKTGDYQGGSTLTEGEEVKTARDGTEPKEGAANETAVVGEDGIKRIQPSCVKKPIKATEYDTDPEEEFDDTPEYLKEREIFDDELEDAVMGGKLPFRNTTVFYGQTRGKTDFFTGESVSTLEPSANMKYKFRMRENTPEAEAESKKRFGTYKKVKKVLRLYILKGVGLTPSDDNGTSDPYLIINYGSTEIIDKERTVRDNTNNPDFYVHYDIPVELPGPGLNIEVWDDDVLGKGDIIGNTYIDLENRFFSKKYQKYTMGKKMPIERRVLWSDSSSAPQGKLEMWLEFLNPKKVKTKKPEDIAPIPQEEFELRTIIWRTEKVKPRDLTTKMNDMFGVAGPHGHEMQETDTHWRCRTGKGSFNWRMKFPMKLPLRDEDFGANIYKIQLWDRDIVASNDMICEADLSLHDHQLLRKAFKRKEPVKMKRLVDEKMMERFWIDLYHPSYGEELQGRVEVSFQVYPKELAEKKPNGLGRDPPNNFPPLPEPQGRFSFDLCSPYQTLVGIFGPEIVNKVICMFCCFACIIFLVWYGPMLLGAFL